MAERTEAEKLGEVLKPRERTFVREYLVDLCGTKAAVRAGYSEKSAASQASRLLRKPEVRAYRDALLQEQFDAIGVTKHSIAAEVWKLYERCTQQRPVRIWDSQKHEYVFAGLWEFDVKGALKALDMLRQMLPEMGKDEGGGAGPSLEDMVMGGGGREF
ncbi:terminase small subunit [uncultured Dysosmobacter sp.]|uniref:terminase small subunit n=1 Tax=uncultured Dysosmobacter sp. TaxID=2591384 RepID=UPI002639CB92|nr:terminase small subunit [uncultured Dysosmobacter sp.]